MQLPVWLEPVEENGLPEIVLIAVEIADGVGDRAAVVDEAAVAVDDPVVVVGAVATGDRDTSSDWMPRPRVRSRPFLLPILLSIVVSHPFRKEGGKNGAPAFISDRVIRVGHSCFPPFPQRTRKEWGTHVLILSTEKRPYLRLSVWGSGWIRTRNSSGASCLKWISSSVEISWTRESGSSSEKVQWQETYRRPRT